MNRFFLATLLCLLPFAAIGEEKELRIIVVLGLGGSDEYTEVFTKSAERWEKAAEKGEAAFTRIGDGEGSEQSAKQLRETIASVKEPELWIVLIGHGSFDSRSVKFNVAGPDFTDDDLGKWIEPYPGELAVINTASSSGSFIRKLSGESRIVITATKNEAEVFYTRFGKFFSEAIGGLADADLDNDEQVSLLESFLYASDKVANFYETEGRLATEHAMLDDNGDKLGSRSEWYEGTTVTRTPGKEAGPDGERAGQKVLVKNEFEKRLTSEQRKRRDILERQVKELRRNRDGEGDEPYYAELEKLLLELAKIYRDAGKS